MTRNGSREKERHAAMGHRSEPNPGTPGKDTALFGSTCSTSCATVVPFFYILKAGSQLLQSFRTTLQ